jgi:hypothetical protein
MKIEKATAGSGTKTEAKRSILASIEFAVRASLREVYVEADFVHSILGKISAKSEDRGDEEDVGYIKASLVQFGEAMDHGISTERLGDGIDANIAEYWELLFDLDTGCWKEEVRDEYETSGCDLLIVDCMEISPEFRRTGVGPIAIDRTIDIFGTGCGLVACKPWPLAIARWRADIRGCECLSRFCANKFELGRFQIIRRFDCLATIRFREACNPQ